eukprot:2150590-Rhodomonas_salina.2
MSYGIPTTCPVLALLIARSISPISYVPSTPCPVLTVTYILLRAPCEKAGTDGARSTLSIAHALPTT